MELSALTQKANTMNIYEAMALIGEKIEPTKKQFGKFSYKVLDEPPVKQIDKRLSDRGIELVVVGENVPSEHGKPTGWSRSGRGAVISEPYGQYQKGEIWVEGGPRGSQKAHPVGHSDKRFYWGVKSKFYQNFDALIISGKESATDDWINKNLGSIVTALIDERLL